MVTILNAKRIWIDLDNSPHVPFFKPIIGRLKDRGYETVVTARDCFQVCGLADKFGLNYRKVGRHYGANIMLKVFGTLWRSFQLMPYMALNRPTLSVSHGSRSLLVLSHALRIPTILIFDYEHVARVPLFKPEIGIAPEIIDMKTIQSSFRLGVECYPGLKEDVYVASFRPDPNFLARLKMNDRQIIVTIRPPATEAHYHNPEAEPLFDEVVTFLGGFPEVTMMILPRNEVTQKHYIERKWGQLCREGKIRIPDQVVNGLDMIWHSDFVVSGGGTMNREAAALGVPVFSIFRGKMGAIDRYLSQQGRLTFIETVNDVRKKIVPTKRERIAFDRQSPRPALDKIVAIIEREIAKRR
jgi:hypothetical protein